MKNASFLLTISLLLAPFCSRAADPADAVYTGGVIYTVDKDNPDAEAIAVDGNSIVFVGSDDEAKAYIGDGTKVVDLEGRFVMPGIVSTHEHSIFYMAVNSGLLFSEVSHDKDKMLAEVKQYLEENPDGPYMAYGGAYESTVKIHRKEIDAITGPDKPFMIMAATGHGGWANSKALELGGVTDDSEPIDFFGKDEDGTRNGYVGTGAAAYYMMGVAGLKKDAVLEAAPDVLDLIASHGVTHLIECGQPPGHEEPLFEAIAQLESDGNLTARYTVCVMVQRQHQVEKGIESLKKFNSKYNSEMFKVNSLKIHGDGSLEGHTANLLEPYADKPGELGILSLPEEKSIEAALEATKLGFDMHTHAIGDAANRSFLNVFQAVRDAGHTESRLTMGHTVLVDDADLDRFKELDVIANYYTLEAAQPFPQYLERLGPERYSKIMRLGTMVDKGIRVTLSQDFPSSSVNPFLHLHAAVTRSLIGEEEILGSEADKLSLAEGIKAYTLDAAYQARAEEISGSLEAGKRADFIVLDRNLFEIPEDEIAGAKVLKTVVDGRTVFDRAEKVKGLTIVKVDVTNPNLQDAVDVENLNLLVEDELHSICVCCPPYTNPDDTTLRRASLFTPQEVRKGFAALRAKGYKPARPARAIYWEKDKTTYWIQWTLKDDVAILFAYDPEAGEAVEILQVREK